jgi:hypothetical protein
MITVALRDPKDICLVEPLFCTHFHLPDDARIRDLPQEYVRT